MRNQIPTCLPAHPDAPSRAVIAAAEMVRNQSTQLLNRVEHELAGGTPLQLAIATEIAAGICCWATGTQNFDDDQADHCLDIAQRLIDRYNARAGQRLREWGES